MFYVLDSNLIYTLLMQQHKIQLLIQQEVEHNTQVIAEHFAGYLNYTSKLSSTNSQDYKLRER